MSVTAKDIAKYLNISTASVSVALNDKPGVSTATRKMIIETARELGYDFSNPTKEGKINGAIYYIRYCNFRSPTEAPFFGLLASSLDKRISERGFRYKSMMIYGDDNFPEKLEQLRNSDCAGILLLGTDISNDRLMAFYDLKIPFVLMDTWFNSPSVDCVKVNNVQGAFMATEYLIKKYNCQPGYIHSYLKLYNYRERFEGYCKALETYRMSVRNSDIMITSPNNQGAEGDMLEILQEKKNFARCYVTDTDAQAVGVMKAFQSAGYKVPGDIAFVGFDNSSHSQNSNPPLTTIEAYPEAMAKASLYRLLDIIGEKSHIPLKIEIGTSLIQRGSA